MLHLRSLRKNNTKTKTVHCHLQHAEDSYDTMHLWTPMVSDMNLTITATVLQPAPK